MQLSYNKQFITQVVVSTAGYFYEFTRPVLYSCYCNTTFLYGPRNQGRAVTNENNALIVSPSFSYVRLCFRRNRLHNRHGIKLVQPPSSPPHCTSPAQLLHLLQCHHKPPYINMQVLAFYNPASPHSIALQSCATGSIYITTYIFYSCIR